MIRIGMVGMSPGNGHPFSFSAILNGYEPDLMAASPYPTIFEYLSQQRNEAFGIPEARVTHIWAQNRSEAEYVARTCHIPHIVKHYSEMLGAVDAVILPNDEGSLHLEMARPFIKAGIPAFIDKPLADNVDDALHLIRMAGEDGLLMSCSALRYSTEVQQLKQIVPKIGPVASVNGVSWRNWDKYGIHLVEAIYVVFGRGISVVRNIGSERESIVHLKYDRGPHVVLNVFDDIAPVIQLSVYGGNGYQVVDFGDWFTMFKNTLAQFINMIKTGQRPIPLDETLEIIKVVYAAQVSLERDGEPVRVDGVTLQ